MTEQRCPGWRTSEFLVVAHGKVGQVRVYLERVCQPVGLHLTNDPFTAVASQISCISDVYIRVHNSRIRK